MLDKSPATHGPWAPEISSVLPEKALILIIFNKLPWMFYQSVVTSILFYTRVCCISKKNFSRQASSEVGMKLVGAVEKRTLNKLVAIMDEASHLLHSLISGQWNLFSDRLTDYQPIKLHTPHTTTPSFRGGRSEEVEYKIRWGMFSWECVGHPKFYNPIPDQPGTLYERQGCHFSQCKSMTHFEVEKYMELFKFLQIQHLNHIIILGLSYWM